MVFGLSISLLFHCAKLIGKEIFHIKYQSSTFIQFGWEVPCWTICILAAVNFNQAALRD